MRRKQHFFWQAFPEAIKSFISSSRIYFSEFFFIHSLSFLIYIIFVVCNHPKNWREKFLLMLYARFLLLPFYSINWNVLWGYIHKIMIHKVKWIIMFLCEMNFFWFLLFFLYLLILFSFCFLSSSTKFYSHDVSFFPSFFIGNIKKYFRL